MQAFHSNWTKPFFMNKNIETYYVEDFELLTTILSALEWKRHNGSIRMVTDEIGAEYYHQLGLEHVWDLGVDDGLGKAVDIEIDPVLFWAAGKIYALQKQKSPCIMIDTDFIIWDSLREPLRDAQLAVIHREGISDSIYPDKAYFDMAAEYEFPSEWDWSIHPCNTAFTYIADESFKDYYCKQSIHFMKNVLSGHDATTNMVFAEQRVIAMCAKVWGISIDSLLDLESGDIERQQHFTHTWGHKRILKAKFSERKKLCVRCVRRILKDFPEEREMLAKIKCIALYFQEASVPQN